VQDVGTQHNGPITLNSVYFIPVIVEPNIIGVLCVQHREVNLCHDRWLVFVYVGLDCFVVQGETHVSDFEPHAVKPFDRWIVGYQHILFYLLPCEMIPEIGNGPVGCYANVIAV
tara:strand:- start:4603 stop:4944 length:342 start_codon:yes stop_codon:yes gene_type:complete